MLPNFLWLTLCPIVGPYSIYGPLQRHNYTMLCDQKWASTFHDTTWINYQRICQTRGETSFEAVSALYAVHNCEGEKFRSQPESKEFRLAVQATLQRADGMQWTQADADQQELCPQFIETSSKQTVKDLPSFLNMLHVLRSAWGTGKEGIVFTVPQEDILGPDIDGVADDPDGRGRTSPVDSAAQVALSWSIQEQCDRV